MGIENRETRSSQSARELFLEALRPFVKSPLVLEAFRRVDRRAFAPRGFKDLAYTDKIIPLLNVAGESSMSQPRLVAEMMEHLNLTGRERVLEIGTGSGYGAALLSCCSSEVHTIECNEELAKEAQKKLKRLGHKKVEVHIGDGALGLPQKAPFDAIIVTASAREIPKALIEQLSEGGRIVIPIEKDPSHWGELILGIKKNGMLSTSFIINSRFLPLISNEPGGWTEEDWWKAREVSLRRQKGLRIDSK